MMIKITEVGQFLVERLIFILIETDHSTKTSWKFLITINSGYILLFNFIEMSYQKKLCSHRQIYSKPSNLISENRKLKTQNSKIAHQLSQSQQQIQLPNNQYEPIQPNSHNKICTQASDIVYHDINCVCKDCDCGRHLCKFSFSCQKPNMKMATIYRKTFKKPSKGYLNHPVFYPKKTQRQLSKSVSITSKTIYQKYYNQVPQHSQKFKNNHHMLQQTSSKAENIPFLKLTTYNTNFIGHKMDNQYVRYQQGIVPNFLSLKATTSYQSDFCNPQLIQKKSSQKNRPISCKQSRKQKQLTEAIMRSTFKSTYQHNFGKIKTQDNEDKNQQPLRAVKNKRSYDDFALINHQKIKTKANLISNYTKDYKLKLGNICPARARIYNMNKSNIQAMRQSLKDNTNYRQLLKTVIP